MAMKFEDIDPVKILSFGMMGLGFLLALLTYHLISKQLSHPEPRKSQMELLKSFMKFSLILCALGVCSELVNNIFKYETNKHFPQENQPVNYTSTQTNSAAPHVTESNSQTTKPEDYYTKIDAANAFVDFIDKGNYSDAYDMLADDAKSSGNYLAFENLMKKMRSVTLNFKGRKLKDENGAVTMPVAGANKYYYVAYDFEYSGSGNIIQVLKLSKKDDGSYKVEECHLAEVTPNKL